MGVLTCSLPFFTFYFFSLFFFFFRLFFFCSLRSIVVRRNHHPLHGHLSTLFSLSLSLSLVQRLQTLAVVSMVRGFLFFSPCLSRGLLRAPFFRCSRPVALQHQTSSSHRARHLGTEPGCQGRGAPGCCWRTAECRQRLCC